MTRLSESMQAEALQVDYGKTSARLLIVIIVNQMFDFLLFISPSYSLSYYISFDRHFLRRVTHKLSASAPGLCWKYSHVMSTILRGSGPG